MSQKFYSDIEARAGLRDSSGALGTSGQILSSTGSNVSWINQSTAANDVQNRVKAGVAINKGQAVYVTGADGTNIIVGLASNASEATSSKTLGLLNATVAINGMADVVQIGRLSGLNTLGATAGDPVWLGTGGNLIYGLIGKPYAPANLVFIGIVTRVNVSNGEIFVNVQNGFELNEIHDVDLKTTVPINGDVLGFNGTLWVNKTIAGWLGYTPANASGTTNYVSKFTGTTTLGNSQIFDNGTNVGIGTSMPGAKLDVSSGNINLSNSFNLTARNNANTFNIALIGRSSTDRVIIDADGYGTNIGGGGTVLINPSGGNVGIGTTSPAYKLDVNGTVNIVGSFGNRGVDAAYRLKFYDNGGVANDAGIGLDGYAGGGEQMWFNSLDGFYWATGTNGEKMRITQAGNVGIGTSNPLAMLHVASGEIRNSFGSGQGGTNYLNIIDGVSNGFRTVVTTSNQINYTFHNGSNQEVLSILNSGNVGIGTTSPDYPLEIENTNQTSIVYQRTGVSAKKWGFISDNGATYWSNITDNILPLTLQNSGNVGIGTTSPSGKLNVLGSGTTAISISNSNAGTSGSPELTQLNFLGFLQENRARIEATDVASSANGSELRFYNANTSNVLTERMRIASNGAVKFNAYGSGSFTGTATQKLAVDSSGNIIEIPIGAGPVDGSGTTNYVTKWTDADTIGNSIMYDNGTNVGIGTSSPTSKLTINGNTHIIGGGTPSSGVGLEMQYSGNTAYIGSYDRNFGVYKDIFFYSANTIFENGGLERMRITSSGNVGIGTSSPNSILHLYKTSYPVLTIGSGTVTGNTGIDTSGNFMSFGTETNHDVSFTTNNTPRMRIASGGNVGIGTTSPSYKTVIHSSSVDTDVLCVSNDQINADSIQHFVGISLQDQYSNGSGNVSAIRSYSNLYAQWGSTLTFSTTGTAGNGIYERMRITNTGNVGIGTTSPSGEFEISKNSSGAYVNSIITNSNSGGYVRQLFNVGASGANGQAGFSYAPSLFFKIGVQAADTTTPITFVNNNDTERMRITSSGNVGIGTTSPSERLVVGSLGGGVKRIYVPGTYNFDGSYLSNYDGNGGGKLELVAHTGVSNSASWRIANNNDTYGQSLTFSYAPNTTSYSGLSYSAPAMLIANTGNVGIGTTSPSAKLDVNGDALINGLTVGRGAGNVNTNTVLGWLALNLNTTGGDNTAIGVAALNNCDTGARNVAVGNSALYYNTTGNDNTAIGFSALTDCETGIRNVTIGNYALTANISGSNNIAIGYGANNLSNVSGLTAIGSNLSRDTNLNSLGKDCLAISQFNGNAATFQVPHIYAPEPVNVGAEVDTDIITFDIDHYAGAIIEYMIRLDDGGDYAVGTVYMGWKDSGSGNMKDIRQIVWNDMSGFDFLPNGDSTLTLRNTTTNSAWIRITVRGMMTN